MGFASNAGFTSAEIGFEGDGWTVYDDGKSWQWYWGDKIPNPKADHVNVTWSKVPD
jgi:hypothetical protein